MPRDLSIPHVFVLQTAANDRRERWRLLKDKIAAYCVTAGGLSIILAVVLIFFYLLYVVFPLLLPAHANSVSVYPTPEAALGKTVFLSLEEQDEVAVRFTDTGKAIFFKVADGGMIDVENLPIPENTQIVSFAHDGLDKNIVAYGLSDGRALVVKHEYKQTYSGNKRTIVPSIQYPLGKTALVIDSQGQALAKLELKLGGKHNLIIAKTADNRVVLCDFSKKESLFDEDAELTRTETLVDTAGGEVDYILMDKQQHNLYLGNGMAT